jgi:hypothetical protein
MLILTGELIPLDPLVLYNLARKEPVVDLSGLVK